LVSAAVLPVREALTDHLAVNKRTGSADAQIEPAT
jgi:hypothetical protein